MNVQTKVVPRLIKVAHVQDKPRRFYKPELDILRFFAFLAVFMQHTVTYSPSFLVQHHVPIWAAKMGTSFAHAGMYGVDVFFALSSYLITELLLREKEKTGKLDVRSFYVRRMLRIWPLYYLFIATVALVPFFNSNGQFGPRYLLTCLFLVGNWGFIVFGTPNGAIAPLWSVSVEEQFYLFWPPLVARLSRQQIIVAAVILICVANLSRILGVALDANTGQFWLSTFSHLDSIAAGILIALMWRAKDARIAFSVRLALVGLSLCCFVAIMYLFPDANQPASRPPALGVLLGYPVAALACAAILIAFIGMPIKSGLIQYLGKISYGLYVFHFACILVGYKILNGRGAGAFHTALSFALPLALTIAISSVSYRFIESPFLDLKKKFTHVPSRPT